MRKPSAQSVRSKQAAIYRYIASTNIETTSADLGLSTKSIRRFLSASPDTIRKSPERFSHTLSLSPREIAKERKQRLVPRLTGKRAQQAFARMNSPVIVNRRGREQKVDTDWLKRSIRYTQATRQKRRVISPEGVISYVPIVTGDDTHHRQEYARRQILSGLGNENTRSLIGKYNAGVMSYDQALANIRQLWKNSDVAFTPEMESKWFDSTEVA